MTEKRERGKQDAKAIKRQLHSGEPVDINLFLEAETNERLNTLDKPDLFFPTKTVPVGHEERLPSPLILSTENKKELLTHWVHGLDAYGIKIEMALSTSDYSKLLKSIFDDNKDFLESEAEKEADSKKDPLRILIGEAVRSHTIPPPPIRSGINLKEEDQKVIRLIQRGYTDRELLLKGEPDFRSTKARLMSLYGAKTTEQFVAICTVLIKE